MERETVSNRFQAQIGDDRVLAALFTTYNFEPEFFEQEVIPLMLKHDVAFSSDARIKAVQVREVLNGNPVPIEVFYDRDIFWKDSREARSPAMEYLHHGIRGDRGAFHAKLILLLLESEGGEQSLKVAAGSANLTNAGWWENVEVQHWESVISGQVQSEFLRILKSDMRWLKEKGGLIPGGALELISEYLGSCRGAATTYSGNPVYYYGLTGVEDYRLQRGIKEPFVNFLVSAHRKQHEYPENWCMEIMSPYFAESAAFAPELTFLETLGVSDIRLFLPSNDQGEVLCRPDYYDKICDAEGVNWAGWSDEFARQLGLNNQTHRTTHAKIYHFYKGQRSWAFVGSVNFTHKAFSDNQEAGFYIKLPHKVQLLEEDDAAPECWADLDEDDSGFDSDSREPVPNIDLIYDWKLQALTARWAKRDDDNQEGTLTVTILSPERREVAQAGRVGLRRGLVEMDRAEIESLLRNSGFLMVRGHYNKARIAFPEHAVLVQQTNWTHKPLDLPHLTPQEILQIYASLSDVRRIEIIERLKSAQLADVGLAGEHTPNPTRPPAEREFFAEYAELFHAFRKLREKLLAYYNSEPRDERRLDYYLSGQSPDSLPILYDSLFDGEAALDPVTAYLALLCLVDIYQQPGFLRRPKVAHYHRLCCEKIREIEAGGDLNLIDGDRDRTQRFFAWYKEQFFRAYTPVEEEVGHEAS